MSFINSLIDEESQKNFRKNVMGDSAAASIARGVASTGGRTLGYINYLTDDVLGLGNVYDPKTLDKTMQKLEEKKEKKSKEGLSHERIAERDKLDSDVAQADGFINSLRPVIKKTADTLFHPSEWTTQGIVETFSPSDPVNLVGFGGGALAAKPFKSTISKALAGAAGGSAEAAIIGGAAEYATTKGMDKSDKEAKKAAITGAIGGIATGAPLGAAGGVVTKNRDGLPRSARNDGVVARNDENGVLTDEIEELDASQIIKKGKNEQDADISTKPSDRDNLEQKEALRDDPVAGGDRDRPRADVQAIDGEELPQQRDGVRHDDEAISRATDDKLVEAKDDGRLADKENNEEFLDVALEQRAKALDKTKEELDEAHPVGLEQRLDDRMEVEGLKDEELASFEMENRYLDSRTGKIKISALRDDAEPLPKAIATEGNTLYFKHGKKGTLTSIPPQQRAQLSAGEIIDQTGLKDNKSIVKGLFEKIGTGGIIRLFKDSDFTTIVHETGHYLEQTLTDAERVAYNEVFGLYKDGRERSEAFAEGFVKWVATDKAPKGIEAVFKKFRQLVLDVFKAIPDSPENRFELTQNQKLFYRAMMGDEKAKKQLAKAMEGHESRKVEIETHKPEKAVADKMQGDWNEKRWRENRVPVSDAVFDKLGIKKGNVFADYIKLSEKHPEYFSEPKEVKEFVEYVFAAPEYFFSATKKEYAMLVRTNGKDKGVVVDLELKGGKYRVRSAIILDDGQLKTKLEKAKQAGEPIFQFRYVNPKEEHPSGGTMPSDIDSPADGSIDQTGLKNNYKGSGESASGFGPDVEIKNILYQTANEIPKQDALLKYPAGTMDKMVNRLGNFLTGKHADGELKNISSPLARTLIRNLEYGGMLSSFSIDSFSKYSLKKASMLNEATDIYRSLKKLSESDRNAMHLWLSGDDKSVTLPAQLQPFYNLIKSKIDANAQKLVELGELLPDEKIDDYIARSYKKDVEEAMSILSAITKSGGSMDHVKARRGKEQSFYLKDEEAAKYKEGDVFTYKNVDFTVDKITPHKDGKSIISVWRDFTFDERTEMGEIRDAAFSVYYTLQKQAGQIARAELIKKLADEQKVFTSDEEALRAGYVKVPDEKTTERKKLYGALSGKYIPAAMKKNLDYYLNISGSFGVATEMLGAVNAMKFLTSVMKIADTVKNASTHLMNIISNIITTVMNDPMAFTRLPNLKSAMERAKRLGVVDGEMPDLESFRFTDDASKNTNILFNAITAAAKNILLTQGSTLGKAVRKAYAFEDNVFKAIVLDQKIKEGMSEAQALAYIQSRYIDYTKPLPPFIRKLDTLGFMPFVGFAYRSTPMVVKSIVNNPVKFTLLLLAGNAFKPTDEQEALVPAYLKGRTNMFFLPDYFVHESEGKMHFFNVGRALPGFRINPIESLQNLMSAETEVDTKLGYVGAIFGILQGKGYKSQMPLARDEKNGTPTKILDLATEIMPNYLVKLPRDLQKANSGWYDKYSGEVVTPNQVLINYLGGKHNTIDKALALEILENSIESRIKSDLKRIAIGDMDVDDFEKTIDKVNEKIEPLVGKSLTYSRETTLRMVKNEINRQAIALVRNENITQADKEMRFNKLKRSLEGIQ